MNDDILNITLFFCTYIARRIYQFVTFFKIILWTVICYLYFYYLIFQNHKMQKNQRSDFRFVILFSGGLPL